VITLPVRLPPAIGVSFFVTAVLDDGVSITDTWSSGELPGRQRN
jgi:hypothetical protein